MKIGELSSVLVVFAHPDDAEFNFAGTVAKLTRAGVEVNYVVCTDGCRGGADPNMADAELAGIRAEEQRAAAKVLGVNEVTFLGHHNGTLQVTVELRKGIVREIRRHRPDAVFTTPPYRVLGERIGMNHAEHIAVGEATFESVYPEAGSIRSYPELLKEGLSPHRVREVWIPALEDANRYIDVSDTIEAKIDAIRCHKSQVEREGRPPWDFGKALAPRMEEAAAYLGCAYAERFRVVPTGH